MSSCGAPTTTGNGAAESEALMPRKHKFDKSKTCIKCKVEPGRIVVRHAVYCKTCFFPMVIHKLKRTLEPSINPVPERTGGKRRSAVLKPSGGLLIGFSGGLGSSVLTDMVKRCYFEQGKRRVGEMRADARDPRLDRVWKEARVAYVEISAAIEGMKVRTDEVRRFIEINYPEFEFVPLRIEDAFDERWWARVGGRRPDLDVNADFTDEDIPISLDVPDPGASNVSPISRLQSYLRNLPSPSSLPTTISTLTRLILTYTSRGYGSSHLLLGNSLTSLSIRLIEGVVGGGGFGVKEEFGEEWGTTVVQQTTDVSNRASGSQAKAHAVRVVRPLKEVTLKECAFWAYWSRIEVVASLWERWGGGASGFKERGIGGLTRDFIIGLEKNYPSTVSTIVRTCAKLEAKKEADEGEGERGKCVLCERPAQRNVQEWKTTIALRSLSDDVQHQSTTISSEATTTNGPSIPSLSSYLCYACHTTLTSRSGKVVPSRGGGAELKGGAERGTATLPIWISARLGRSATGNRSGGFEQKGSETRDGGEEGEVWRVRKMGEGEMRSTIGEFLVDG